MLDILRRHSSSVVIKLTLGAIIVSFALFFGFGAARKGQATARGGSSAVATVNGHAIPAPIFGYFYENQYEQMRQGSKDKELPQFAQELAKNYALQRAITREMLYLQAQKFGIVVQAGRHACRLWWRNRRHPCRAASSTRFFTGNDSCPTSKSLQFDYEAFLKEDIEIELLRELFASVDSGSPVEPKDSLSKKWSFEVVEIKDGQKNKALSAIKAGEKAFTADSKSSLPPPKRSDRSL